MRHRLMRKHLMITSTAIGTFTPANRDDFGARARSLSKLLKQPYQRCQESLAKLYGYGDLHQLQAAIKRAEVDPTLQLPYDDQWSPIDQDAHRITPEMHTSQLQYLMHISYAFFCVQKQ